MTHGALRVSAIVLGMAAFVSIIPLSTASADFPRKRSDALAKRASAYAKRHDAPDRIGVHFQRSCGRWGGGPRTPLAYRRASLCPQHPSHPLRMAQRASLSP